MALTLDSVVLAIIVATLAAIVYSLRFLVLLERRLLKIDYNIERIAMYVAKEETDIDRKEKSILKRLSGKRR